MKLEIQYRTAVAHGEDAPDKKLEQNIKGALGNPHAYIHSIVDKVFQEINGCVAVPDYLGVKIIATSKPKVGVALRWSKKSRSFPSVIVGFSGDIPDFTITLVHEVLHYIKWDEYIVEKKAKDICGGAGP